MTFNYNGKFVKGIKTLVKPAQKAFSLCQKMKKVSLMVYIQLKLLNLIILPIMTYCYEIWGFQKLQTIKKICLQFCRKEPQPKII